MPERQSCACLRGQYTLQKIITRHSNQVPRLNLHSPQHRRCPTSRDFVPWRFSDAGRRSAWIASSCRHPKTCTTSDFGIRGRCATLDDVETLCGREYRWHSTVSAGAPSLSKRQAKRSSLALMLAILSAAPWKVAGRCLPIGLHRFFRSVAVGAVVSQSKRCSDHCLTWPGTPAIDASTDVASHTFPTCYCHREP